MQQTHLLTLVALAVVPSHALATADADVTPAKVFTEACLDGGLKTQSVIVRNVSYSSLPYSIRMFFGLFGSGEFYALSGKVDGYLILGKARWSTAPAYDSVCAVVTFKAALGDAVKSVLPLLFTNVKTPADGRVDHLQIDNLKDGYTFTARYLMQSFNGAGGFDAEYMGNYVDKVGPGVWSSVEIRHFSVKGLAKATKRVRERN